VQAVAERREPVGDRAGSSSRGLPTRRALIRNAALVGAVAWTAPVLLDSMASPAAAASCTATTLDWNSIATGAGGTTTCSGSSTGTTPPCTTTSYTPPAVGGVTVTFSAVAFPGTTLLSAGANRGNGNLTVRAAPNGGLGGQKALQLVIRPDTTAVGETVTMSFSRPVQNLSFTVYDIDNRNAGWGDRVFFDIAPTTVSFTNPAWTPTTSNITGAGTAANPLRSTSPNTNFADTSSLGNATVTFAGPITSLRLTLANAVNAGGRNERVGIGPISYCA
jgi:hypothetical protein